MTFKALVTGLLAGLFVLSSQAQQTASPAPPPLAQIRGLEVARIMAMMHEEAFSGLDYAQLYEACMQKPAPAELLAAPLDKFAVARAMLSVMIELRSSPDATVNAWAEQCKRQLMKQMGPRGRFFSPAEFADFRQSAGNFGLDLVMMRFDGEWVVREALQNSAAAAAGLHTGAILESVDGVRVRDLSGADLKEAMDDESASQASVVWRSQGTSQSAVIKRSQFVNPASVFAQKFPDHFYIRIKIFRKETPQQLTKALRDLALDSETARVLDLRGNIGGLFLESEWLVALLGDSSLMKSWPTIKYRQELAPRKVFSASERLKTLAIQAPQISDEEWRVWSSSHKWLVIVDGNTASAGAWFASVLRELNGAVLLGQPTDQSAFGVDSIRPVDQAGGVAGLRYESGQLMLPSGQALDSANTSPDIPLPLTLETIRPYPKSATDWLNDPVYLQIKDRLQK